MKKPLSHTINQQGFILPYVLFFIAFSLIIISSSVNLYQNETHITHNQTEQIKIESLFQMARIQAKETIRDRIEPYDAISYSFPQGEVVVEYGKLNEHEYRLIFTIETDSGAITVLNDYFHYEAE
ncbi:ComG operon protein 7 [Lentibacillus persicus]|uniref:ComG operon protein 7 n=1 Tax=Lentibacillus persicus TaxID=640948 RepID=A0A1I1T5G6_9BACI|nr:competence type IV pilus minor pilin ComGG [Lentibacillus persicus]SFD53907.1 ComG operon protein 7 [Lentibacillus persicus]